MYAKQFGFRKSHSSAMLVLVDKISKALDGGEYAIGNVNVFAIINFNLLFDRYHYGIRDSDLNWYILYLLYETLFVVFLKVPFLDDYYFLHMSTT